MENIIQSILNSIFNNNIFMFNTGLEVSLIITTIFAVVTLLLTLKYLLKPWYYILYPILVFFIFMVSFITFPKYIKLLPYFKEANLQQTNTLKFDIKLPANFKINLSNKIYFDNYVLNKIYYFNTGFFTTKNKHYDIQVSSSKGNFNIINKDLVLSLNNLKLKNQLADEPSYINLISTFLSGTKTNVKIKSKYLNIDGNNFLLKNSNIYINNEVFKINAKANIIVNNTFSNFVFNNLILKFKLNKNNLNVIYQLYSVYKKSFPKELDILFFNTLLPENNSGGQISFNKWLKYFVENLVNKKILTRKQAINILKNKTIEVKVKLGSIVLNLNK